MVLQGWHTVMQPLVARFGAALVRETSLRHPEFGYPAEWIEEVNTAKRLRRILEAGT